MSICTEPIQQFTRYSTGRSTDCPLSVTVHAASFYGTQTKLRKVMFSRVSVCPKGERQRPPDTGFPTINLIATTAAGGMHLLECNPVLKWTDYCPVRLIKQIEHYHRCMIRHRKHSSVMFKVPDCSGSICVQSQVKSFNIFSIVFCLNRELWKIPS